MFSEDLFKQQTGEDFTKFYEEYNPKLISFIANICKNKDMAQDIATNSYIAAFDNMLSYNKEISKFSTWLFTIAKNKTLREISISKRISYEEIEFIDKSEEEKQEDTIFDDKAQAKIVIEQINNLPNKYKDVMNMFLVEKLKYVTISETLNVNLNTIKSWIRKGKSLLRDLSEIEFNKIKNNTNEFTKYS